MSQHVSIRRTYKSDGCIKRYHGELVETYSAGVVYRDVYGINHTVAVGETADCLTEAWITTTEAVTA